MTEVDWHAQYDRLWQNLWVCGANHTIYVEPGTPPYDMPPCPLCRAQRLEKEWRLEARHLLSFLKTDAEAYISDWPEAFPHFRAALEEE